MITIDTRDVVLAFNSLKDASAFFPNEFSRAWRQVGPQLLAHVRKVYRTGGNLAWNPLHRLTLAQRRRTGRNNEFGGKLPRLMRYDLKPDAVAIGYIATGLEKYMDNFQSGDISGLKARKLERSQRLMANLDKATTGEKRKAMFKVAKMLERESKAAIGIPRDLFGKMTSDQHIIEYVDKTLQEKLQQVLRSKVERRPRRSRMAAA